MEIFNCYSARLASFLKQRGFKIIDTRINIKDPKYDVFLFEKTEPLMKAVDEYCQK